MLLLKEVLNRIQFRYNQAQLEELDDETLDDDVRGFTSRTAFVSCAENYICLHLLLPSVLKEHFVFPIITYITTVYQRIQFY